MAKTDPEQIDYGTDPTIQRPCIVGKGSKTEHAAYLTAVDNRPETVKANGGEGLTIDACLDHAAEEIWAKGLDAKVINAHVPAS